MNEQINELLVAHKSRQERKEERMKIITIAQMYENDHTCTLMLLLLQQQTIRISMSMKLPIDSPRMKGAAWLLHKLMQLPVE